MEGAHQKCEKPLRSTALPQKNRKEKKNGRSAPEVREALVEHRVAAELIQPLELILEKGLKV